MKLGLFLSELRKKRGLSQNDIASILGYSPQLISLWEKDKTTPDLAVVSKYAQILSIDLDGFFNGVEQKNNDNCVNKKFDIASFATFIKKLRKENGLLQNDVANKLNVNVKNISAWENMSSTPSLDQFVSLCKLFNLSYDELYFCYRDEKKEFKTKPIISNKKQRTILPLIIAIAVLSLGGVGTAIGLSIKKNQPSIIIPPITYKDNLVINTETNKVTYGYYPQSKVTDPNIISALNGFSSPTLGDKYFLNDFYYLKSGKNWFRCDEITWYIISHNENEYKLVSEKLLDVKPFYQSLSDRTIDDKTIYPTNYEYSDIRSWLNSSFYESAFFLHNAHIKITTVDNSATTTDSSTNPYICSNTEDKVFLMSYQEYSNMYPGYKRARCTEFTIANGGYNDSGYGYCWTRSPYSLNQITPWCVDQFGELYTNYGGDVTVTNCNIRPAIIITKE